MGTSPWTLSTQVLPCPFPGGSFRSPLSSNPPPSARSPLGQGLAYPVRRKAPTCPWSSVSDPFLCPTSLETLQVSPAPKAAPLPVWGPSHLLFLNQLSTQLSPPSCLALCSLFCLPLALSLQGPVKPWGSLRAASLGYLAGLGTLPTS